MCVKQKVWGLRILQAYNTVLERPILSRFYVYTIYTARKSLVSDIPTGDGNVANLFLQCTVGTFCRDCTEVLLW